MNTYFIEHILGCDTLPGHGRKRIVKNAWGLLFDLSSAPDSLKRKPLSEAAFYEIGK